MKKSIDNGGALGVDNGGALGVDNGGALGVDNGGALGALLTDLSNAFDFLSYELLIAKLDAYGFDKSSKLMHTEKKE